jgi:choline kinase/mannose-6-phosphate isomerase-like protein (cupin superfamily)/thiamine kinase-like enzyme
MKTVYKPWGKEVWLELNDHYCYKRIYINSGYKTSYQYHNKKRETNYIISGKAEVWLENDNGIVEKKIMTEGDYFNVTPPKKHRVIALTDIVLQEVSTPEVDDVIRIEDDTNRKDGRLDGEHVPPCVCILAAGLGSRLKHHVKTKNKALIPINNKAIISHIIDKFPLEYEIIIATGYKSESLIEYCNIAHSNRKIKYQNVDKWEDSSVGPGYSILKCKEFLQRPFYITTVDCLIDSNLPPLDGNWLGVQETSYPEKYSTVDFDADGNVIDFKNKSKSGFDYAFIGLASVLNYEVFWNELSNNMKDYELVSAWLNPKNYPGLKAKKLKWIDSGNLDDLESAKIYFDDTPLSLSKDTEEVTYNIDSKIIKFNPDTEVTKNRYLRGSQLGDLIPSNLKGGGMFISYDWEDGNTLYSYNSFVLYKRFLDHFNNVIKKSTFKKYPELIVPFYIEKTFNRIKMFTEKYDSHYLNSELIINSKRYPTLNSLLECVKDNSSILLENDFYSNFHGDLQFDNIIYTSNDTFKYIDWRHSFAGSVECGDLYYDLSKLYGGSILSYDMLKSDNIIHISEGSSMLDISYPENEQLSKFKDLYEDWLSNKYDINKVKLITGLIYINMAPLHTHNFSKLLLCKSIELLNEYFNNK